MPHSLNIQPPIHHTIKRLYSVQKYKLPILILTGLVVIITVLLLSGEPERLLGRSSTGDEPLLPTAVAKNPRSRHYDVNGKLNYSFKAEQLLYFVNENPKEGEEANYTLIEKPKITVFDEQSPWLIEAQHGHVNSDNSVIQLSQSVIIHRTTLTGAKVELKTEELIIELTEKRATTDKPVTIHTDLSSMSAIGMEADFTSKKIKLLSQVRGVHKPK